MRPISSIFTALAACAFAIAFVTPAFASPPTVLVDGRPTVTDVPAIGDGGRMLVPLRILEQLGAQVTFDAAAGAADIHWRGVEAKIYAGSQVAWVDGGRMAMDYPPREFAGRMEVPLRFLTQAFHVDTDYDSGTNTIAIVTGQAHGSFVATLSGPSTASSSPSTSAYASGGGAGPTLSVAPPTADDLRPAPNSVVGSTYPQIYARLAGNSSSVNPSTVHLVVDGGDVTGSAAISSAYVSYTPSAGLANGSHTVEVTGQSDDGASLDQTWSFRVDAGTNYNYASSVVGYNPGAYGYGRFGYCPPGFSLYSPGPIYLVAGNVVEVIFFSRFFPYGSGFFTIGGVPGNFALQPWYGYPGYYWGMMTVPFGVHARSAVLAAKFTTRDGRNVVVHSTAPLRIDGERRTLPTNVRYAVLPSIVNRPTSPRGVVVFRSTPVAMRPVGRLQPAPGRLPTTVMPVVGAPRPLPRTVPLPVPLPAPVVVPRPVVVPVPVPLPVQPVAPRPLPMPQPISLPPQPVRPMPLPGPKATPHA